jgi:GR25 family glycosyltransferase involved in LPS biosynthesis
MLKNVYILHIDDPKSLQYLNDCLESCKQFPDINAIPVQGYKGVNYKDICDEFGIGIIPFYVNQMAENGDTINKAFSCTAGHIKIWQMIVDSDAPGVVLEHDAIIKGPLVNVDVNDDEILWLGPRIDLEHDYTFPPETIFDYVDINRWEGTHAYAITPKTAQFLLDSIKKFGLNDSIDGQLGMRNMFDMNFVTINPPVAVAVVGNRESCIESHGNPGFWNAYHSDQFLKNLKPGCKVPPLRQLMYTDMSFNTLVPALEQVLRGAGKLDGKEQSVLVQGGYEGLSSVWLSNKLLQHDDSYMQIVSSFASQNAQKICAFNTYFSKYYYKLNMIPIEQGSTLLEQAVNDPEIRFDVIFSDGNKTFKEVLYDGILQWNLLKSDGILIFNGEVDVVHEAVKNIIDAVNPIVLYKDKIIVLKKL